MASSRTGFSTTTNVESRPIGGGMTSCRSAAETSANATTSALGWEPPTSIASGGISLTGRDSTGLALVTEGVGFEFNGGRPVLTGGGDIVLVGGGALGVSLLQPQREKIPQSEIKVVFTIGSRGSRRSPGGTCPSASIVAQRQAAANPTVEKGRPIEVDHGAPADFGWL